jgi:hypothetical protein
MAKEVSNRLFAVADDRDATPGIYLRENKF